MGTRAIITLNGKPIIATHWDGYPEALGKQLKKMPDMEMKTIIGIAEQHQIDFIEKSIGEELKQARIEQIARKHNISVDQVRQGYRRGGLISSDDYEIGDIAIYDDWAEYQYDIRGDFIYYRSIGGSWKDERDNTGWKVLRKPKEVVEIK